MILTMSGENFKMDPAELNYLISKGKSYQVQANKVLFSETQHCNSIIYIKSGVARQFLITEEGNELTKAFLKNNEFIMYSIVSFITGKSGEINFETLVPCEFVEWRIPVFEQLKGKEKYRDFLNQMLAKIIVQQDARENSLLRDRASTRLQDFLGQNADLFCKIPHYYIASYLRITPETLSRIRKRLSNVKTGLILSYQTSQI